MFDRKYFPAPFEIEVVIARQLEYRTMSIILFGEKSNLFVVEVKITLSLVMNSSPSAKWLLLAVSHSNVQAPSK